MRNDNEKYMYTAMLQVRPLPGLAFGSSYAYNQRGTDREMTVLGDPELENFLVQDGETIDWEEYYAFNEGTITLGKRDSFVGP